MKEMLKMNYKKMREYTHEEFVNLVMSLNEKELLDLSSNYGGYPVLYSVYSNWGCSYY